MNEELKNILTRISTEENETLKETHKELINNFLDKNDEFDLIENELDNYNIKKLGAFGHIKLKQKGELLLDKLIDLEKELLTIFSIKEKE